MRTNRSAVAPKSARTKKCAGNDCPGKPFPCARMIYGGLQPTSNSLHLLRFSSIWANLGQHTLDIYKLCDSKVRSDENRSSSSSNSKDVHGQSIGGTNH